MARGKVQLKRIQNPGNRRVTFSKRKTGLLKKAGELSLLCDAEVALIIFSPSGKLFEFANTSMNRVMEKYHDISSSTRYRVQLSKNIEILRLEAEKLEKRMAHLEKVNKHMIGEDLQSESMKHLQCLEKKINLGARKIHSRQHKMSLEHIESLKTKAQSLKAENANLCEKIGRSRKAQEFSIDTNGGFNDNMKADAVTQQDLPTTNLYLCLS